MEISLQITDDVARVLHQHQPSSHAKADELLRTLNSHGLTLRPVHPETDVPSLRRHFVATIPDESSDIEGVLEHIRSLDGVEGVYIKPKEDIP